MPTGPFCIFEGPLPSYCLVVVWLLYWIASPIDIAFSFSFNIAQHLESQRRFISSIINLLSPIKDNIAKTAKMSLYAVFKWFWIYLCSFLKIYHVLKLLCEVHWYIGLFFLLTAYKRPYEISLPIILRHLLNVRNNENLDRNQMTSCILGLQW